ncbi:MAG: flagellin [Roseiarcus sp.]
MSSILTNPSALSALQALQMTQNEMAQTQSQVSTGLAVASAADNASYWSIGTQLSSASDIVTAANSSLTQSQSVLDTASSAISSVITTINSIQATLTEAQNPGANIGNINTTLAALGKQLTQEIGSASFNGINVLDGSAGTEVAGTAGTVSGTTTTGTATAAAPATATLSFVSGFNASASGGSFTTISLDMQSLTGTGGILTSQAVAGAAANGTSPAVNAGIVDLTNITIGTGGTDVSAATALAGVEQSLGAVTTYAATIGSVQNQMTAASTFNSALTTDYANGVSGLVDANMNTASTRLQALQTQEQLGIQSLSIANQNAQLILKLFP